MLAARNALHSSSRKTSSLHPATSKHLHTLTNQPAGLTKHMYSSVMKSCERYRGYGRGENGMLWSAIGALTALLLTTPHQTECESATMAPPRVTAVIPVSSQSLIWRIKQKVVIILREILDRLQKFWRMLVRCGTLAAIFVPVFGTLPVAITFQYSQFTDATENVDFWWWRALRVAVRASGPCTIKLAQWMATRPDLFPFCVCRNLQELQVDASPPRGAATLWRETEAAISEAVGPDWQRLYEIKGDTLLGAGCVAQVHLGHVIATGQPIAVKVIHKNVAETIGTDIEIMLWLSSWLELIPGVTNLSLSEIVQEFSELMVSQLDLRREAQALMKFRKNFGCDADEHKNQIFGSSNGVVQVPSATDGFAHKAYITNKVAVTFPMPLPGLAFKNVLFETFEEGVCLTLQVLLASLMRIIMCVYMFAACTTNEYFNAYLRRMKLTYLSILPQAKSFQSTWIRVSDFL